MMSGLLELLFPSRCRICGIRSSTPICAPCLDGFLRLNIEHACKRCGKPRTNTTPACEECRAKTFYFTRAISVGVYEGSLKEAVRHLKYKNGKLLAPYLASFMVKALDEVTDLVDSIAYVPLTKRKEAIRGYNQSRLIAQELSRLSRKPCIDVLVRLNDNREQNKSSLSDRTGNVMGAFGINGTVTGGVLLVDDVYTTGSTVNECARILSEAGAGDIFVITLARATML